MSFIELPGLQDAREPIVAPEGANYDLCITSAKIHTKDGKDSLECIFEIEGGEDYAPIWSYNSFPNSNDEEDIVKFKNLMLRRFLVQFKIPHENGFEVEQVVGCRATACTLTQEVFESNLSNKLTLNRLPNEGPVAA